MGKRNKVDGMEEIITSGRYDVHKIRSSVPYINISITDPDTDRIHFYNNPLRLGELHLKFWDRDCG